MRSRMPQQSKLKKTVKRKIKFVYARAKRVERMAWPSKALSKKVSALITVRAGFYSTNQSVMQVERLGEENFFIFLLRSA